MSTAEEVHDDGSTRNPTRSLCDPYVFNTAVTRAKSLVVAVGNPFFLLKMEQQVVRLHGKRGNCWSTFLKNCIEKGTLTLPKELPEAQKKELILELQKSIKQLDPDMIIDSLREELDAAKSKQDSLHEELHASKSKEDALSEQNKQLQAELSKLKDQLQQLPSVVPHPHKTQISMGSLHNNTRIDPSHLNHVQGIAMVGMDHDPTELQRQPSHSEQSPRHSYLQQSPLRSLQLSQSPIHEADNCNQHVHEDELSPLDTYHSIPGKLLLA